ncbi:hypothetical protein EDB85DRAFT_1885418 [Lactarius pseudohatsudake]|nr:hypothetical protein EDB85DRAFT_1885418 [Lactarius pseudohatsudake]
MGHLVALMGVCASPTILSWCPRSSSPHSPYGALRERPRLCRLVTSVGGCLLLPSPTLVTLPGLCREPSRACLAPFMEVSRYLGSMPLECCSVPSLPPSSRHDHQTSDLPPFTDGAVIGVLRREALASVRAVVVGPLPWWATVSDIDGHVDGHPFTLRRSFRRSFRRAGDDRLFVVDVIVCVDSGRQAGTGSSALRPFPGRPRNGLLTSNSRSPPEDLLDTNDLVKSPDAGKPDFIKQLEKELRLHRAAIGFKGPEVHTLRLLKDLLGESFGEYFTESSDLPEIPRVSDLELLHYVVALSDSHLGDAVAFTAKPEKHIYSLLRRFIKHPPQDAGLQCGTSWSFGLVVEVEGDELQYKYTPQSDFSMSIGGFPHLVAKVVSDRGSGKDKNRMLLQASWLVRLGNFLCKGEPPKFAIKAIYFDRHFHATEYTLYQRGSGPDSRVEYSTDVHDLSQRRDMFTLVFRLYNFRLSMLALHEKLSKDLANSLSVIQTDSPRPRQQCGELTQKKEEHGPGVDGRQIRKFANVGARPETSDSFHISSFDWAHVFVPCIDHKRFRLYKPPLSHPIDVSDSLNGLQLTEEHLTDPLLPPYTVKKKFQEKFQENGDDRRLSVDVIVCVDSGRQAGTGSSALCPFPGRPRNGLLTSVTFRLRNHLEFPLPPEDLLGINGLTEPPDREAPDFVKQLEEELCLQRSPSCHGATPPLLGSLNTLLGESFSKYFADPSDEPEMHPVSDLELLHYVDILLDHQLSSQGAYRDNAWPHVYSLLRRFTAPSPLRCDAKLLLNTLWPFSLVVEDVQNDALYRHTPRSDFSMVVKGFPYLLLGVYSDKPHREGARLMLLQASCLVRLGNALLAGGSSTFFIKVIYVDRDYHAVEYTLYQRGPKPCDDSDDKAGRVRTRFPPLQLLPFDEFSALTKFPLRLAAALPSILGEVEYLPYLTGGHGCSRSGSSAPTSLDGQCSSETAATLLNPRVREAVERGGYTLLPGGSTRLKPTVGKAISHDISPGLVALKLLDGATEELQILQRLLAFRSEANHAIKLLDVIELNTELSSRCHSNRDAVANDVGSMLGGETLSPQEGVASRSVPRGRCVSTRAWGCSPRPEARELSSLSVIAESEETLVEGYRGTPSWAAPEVGESAEKYSAILADRWSCGKVLKYFADSLPIGSTSTFEPICTRLLSSVPRERPSLSAVLQVLRCTPDPWGVRAEKRGGEVDEATAAWKRHRVVCVLRAQLQIHVQMQPFTGTGAPRHSVQCIATPYRASDFQSGCTFYFYITSFLCLYCRST